MDTALILVFLDHLGKAMLHWNQAVCQSKWISYLEFHGMVPGFLLGTLWFLSGWVRSKEIRRIDKTNSARRLPSPSTPTTAERRRSLRSHNKPNSINSKDLNNTNSYPSVAIVLPTRGYRPNSIQNWQAVLHLDYPHHHSNNSVGDDDIDNAHSGHLEFIFVMEDKHDAAHTVVQNLVKSTNMNTKLSNNRSARIVYSGLASNSSQKIHNLIAGISAANTISHSTSSTTTKQQPKYILCLDDDVHLHPTALLSLIRDMEAAPELRIATGYPFDIPAEHAGILSYAALAYHLPLVIGFSLKERTHFVWGGCMLFRAQDVRQEDDLLGFLSGWAHGGYSDDLTVAARCTELGLQVLCPSYAIFPQYLDAHYSPRRYWNYLRRQLVVLDTYASDHNRRTNHVMAVLHCYFSWAFVVPVLTCVLKLLFRLGIHCIAALSSVLLAAGVDGDSNDAANRLLLKKKQQHIADYYNSMNTTANSLGYISAVSFVVCSLYAALALRWMTSIFCTVMEKLNLQSLQPGLLIKRFNWIKLWVGFVAANTILPVCMVYTFMTRHITWAGVKYHRKSGKIIGVEH